MKFILNRNKTVTSVTGHAIAFAKGEPTYVPPEVWAEVQAIGAIPEEDIPEVLLAATEEPADINERKNKIFVGFEALSVGKLRESFSGTGVPHVKALASQIGFVIDAKERDALWQEYKTKDADE